MVRPPEEAIEKLARVLLGVGAEQAKAELASGEISGTPAGDAFAIVLAQARVIEAARLAVMAYPCHTRQLAEALAGLEAEETE